MNFILAKTKMCADKAGLALGLGFERVSYNGKSKTVFTTPTTLEAEKSKIDVTPQPIKKHIPQPIKKKPAPRAKRSPQPKMRAYKRALSDWQTSSQEMLSLYLLLERGSLG